MIVFRLDWAFIHNFRTLKGQSKLIYLLIFEMFENQQILYLI
jgi:hypothetical protein